MSVRGLKEDEFYSRRVQIEVDVIMQNLSVM